MFTYNCSKPIETLDINCNINYIFYFSSLIYYIGNFNRYIYIYLSIMYIINTISKNMYIEFL